MDARYAQGGIPAEKPVPLNRRVQEQEKRITQLEAQNENLRSELERLQERFSLFLENNELWDGR